MRIARIARGRVALSSSETNSRKAEQAGAQPQRSTQDQLEPNPHLSVVLLVGGFSPPPLAEAAGCSPLDLLVSENQTVCDRWMEAIGELGAAVTIDETLCLCGGLVPPPRSALGAVRIITDEHDYRGPAGALRDAVAQTRDAAVVLVVEAARICTVDLRAFLRAHLSQEAAITVAAHADGSPAGLYLLAPSTLDLIPHKGFIDLKEQWLGKALAKGLPVSVHYIPDGSCPPIRTRAEYIRSVIAANQDTDTSPADTSLEPRILPGTEQTRSVVCPTATVDTDAVVVDSVVMPGGVVEPGAIVIRSLVCTGTRIPAGQTVIDSVFGPRGLVRDPSTLYTETSA